ncbi:creatininase family protein [Herbiconiux sp. CPCC 205716]|uniref:Creatininase family protein n=1 Tax=Herbiconiux gentiana TaxID=2970912 RepID=A0ABT2GKT2_9MICO|nr:creatininase family protein [Herbiconiux gentiana]MCS5715366.1 creatininase family protein [Herbiconiux gentiana]
MSIRTRRLVELSGTAAEAALSEDSVIVLPTGAIEFHGPHLPLMTDYLIADAVANASVERAAAEGQDVWILPTLAYTKSDEHHWAPGTMWISWDTLMQTVVELGNSIAATPARKLVFFNGHGGNLALLQVACRELRRRFGLQTFLMGATVPAGAHDGPEELGLGIHAGHSETSLVLHLRPELVDLSVAERSVPAHLADYEHIGFKKRVTFGWLSNDFSTNGTLGDPTGATAEYGKTLFDAAVTDSVAAFAEIARFDAAGPSPSVAGSVSSAGSFSAVSAS